MPRFPLGVLFPFCSLFLVVVVVGQEESKKQTYRYPMEKNKMKKIQKIQKYKTNQNKQRIKQEREN
jgi:hypothetical protein